MFDTTTHQNGMKKILFFIVTLMIVALPSNGKNDNRITNIIVSLDGCRWDYTEWYDTPFFDFMAEQGVKSALIPAFPSKTFPNHYTIATGLYPDHHGLIANNFYDEVNDEHFSLGNRKTKLCSDYYGGEPIWITAKNNGLKTAVIYWPGSDVKIRGSYPDIYYRYDDEPRLTFKERVSRAIELLKSSERPDLIMLYFDQPDTNGHQYGPYGKETRKAVEEMDRVLKSLYKGIDKAGLKDNVNLIVTSDHGMTPVIPKNIVRASDYIKPSWVKFIEGNLPANIYVKAGCADSICNALKGVRHIKTYKKQDMPEYLHYGRHHRCGDVIVIPDPGWVFGDRESSALGAHGYDPAFFDMHAMFRAIGPSFRHVDFPHFDNINVYPLLCHLLGIEPAMNDGDIKNVKGMLK